MSKTDENGSSSLEQKRRGIRVERAASIVDELVAPAATTISTERVIEPQPSSEDKQLEASKPELRPHSFASYIGQTDVKDNLQVYVAAASQLGKQLDHVILHGPPGLGKTTLARIIAAEISAPIIETRGPAIDRAGDLAGILTGLTPGCVLFIDEIHRLPIKVEEALYAAMEDFHFDFMIGERASTRVTRLPLAQFTLVGATTRLSLLSKPLLDRFGIQERLAFYDQAALCQILQRSAGILGIAIDESGAKEIAARSRGTPRVANRLLKRVWDFSVGFGRREITAEFADKVLLRLGIDQAGLDRSDMQILRTVCEQYGGGPVGIEALAASLSEDRATLEEVYEPYLVFQGYLARGPRGRILTTKGRQHLEQRS